MFDIVLICIAGFAAGALNAVAGGGTFLTFPVSVYLGIPTVTANATATLTALPGYVASAWAFRDDLRAQGSLGLASIFALAVAGGLIGAALLASTSDQIFSGIVPWLLLIATALFAAGPHLTAALRKRGIAQAGPSLSVIALLLVSIYGGYFNGGLGIMLLAVFGLLGYCDLHTMNGLKNVMSAILSLASAIAFIAAGLIAWEAAIPMAISATIGGFFGARMSRKVSNDTLLRLFVVLVGVVMTVVFFMRS